MTRAQVEKDRRLEGWRVGRLEGWKVGGLEGWLKIYTSKHLNFYKTGLYVFNPKS
jgi:hypothetical protein